MRFTTLIPSNWLRTNLLAAGLAALLLPAISFAEAAVNAEDAYVGRWDVTLRSGAKEYPTWLEIAEANGQTTVRMVGRWGHARELPKAEISANGITFTSPKEEEGGKQSDMVFQGKLFEGKLSGTAEGPDGARWEWEGDRAPSLKSTGHPKWKTPIVLFDGKNLSAWKTTPAEVAAWKIENGTLISPGHGPDLITNAKFSDFKLHVEFNCSPKSNSGVYLRGRYEVQIENDAEPEGPTMRTGGVYGFLAPVPEVPRTPGVWQTYDITLIGRTVTVLLNGKTIIDHKEIPGITGGALDSQESKPGPIYLQGSEDGHVAFRHIVITPAQD
jgi:hypothetical protein